MAAKNSTTWRCNLKITGTTELSQRLNDSLDNKNEIAFYQCSVYNISDSRFLIGQ